MTIVDSFVRKSADWKTTDRCLDGKDWIPNESELKYVLVSNAIKIGRETPFNGKKYQKY